MATAAQIRSTFIDWFTAQDHQHVPSSPLVPRNDPTLLFTNSGMVQFKNTFTGQETRDYDRAVTAQKCVRAGGKHNDLENVGYTARHHTFFEMLGNFSFGDYFKERAIELAWGLITKDYGMAKDRLLVTVYQDDDQAATLWRKIASLSEDRIIRIATSDNFWSMGDAGPCGPCSEIFYDYGESVAGGPPGSKDENGDRFVEIWNLVFMQYNQSADGTRTDLPKPCVDTGMGLERIASILQGKTDNYDTDIFTRLTTVAAEVTGATGKGIDPTDKPSLKVMADHVRCASFLLADGVIPGNEGRGYVLRRIIRRAVRHGRKLGAREPVLYRMVDELVTLMGQAYREINQAQAMIEDVLRTEEERFLLTLDRGLGLLAQESEKLGEGGALPGDVAFRLYDTYGFPLDLTQDVLAGQGKAVDVKGFEQAMERQRTQARAAWAGGALAADQAVWHDLAAGPVEFIGYQDLTATVQVLALVVDGQAVDHCTADLDKTFHMVISPSPFYARAGGQVGDEGTLTGAGIELAVTDCQRMAGELPVLDVCLRAGTVACGDELHAQVDAVRRDAIARHHSATHLLHAALRHRLGGHVTQRGSLVAPDRLRFDISHPKPISAQDLSVIADDINSQIRANTLVRTDLMSHDSAVEQGAMALFGEKYGDVVRVVSMGEDSAGGIESKELCGGTHVVHTGDIGAVALVSEGAVAAGVRRLEALAGEAALAHWREQGEIIQRAAGLLKVSPSQLVDRLTGVLAQQKKTADEGEPTETKEQRRTSKSGIACLTMLAQDMDGRYLRSLADRLQQTEGEGVIAIAGIKNGRASLVVRVSKGLTETLDAVTLVQRGVVTVKGRGGGGRRDMAQGGGPDGAAASQALEAIWHALDESS
ncbi:MAG: alanine--tRNA ligase [Pseudomonadota bacterium]